MKTLNKPQLNNPIQKKGLYKKHQVTLQLTQQQIKELNSRKSHAVGEKGVSRALVHLLECYPPELDPHHDRFNSAAHLEYMLLLTKHGIPLRRKLTP